MAVKHFSASSPLEFRAELQVPRRAPIDHFEDEGTKHNNISIYVGSVSIMNGCDACLPEWLSFVQSVVYVDTP